MKASKNKTDVEYDALMAKRRAFLELHGQREEFVFFDEETHKEYILCEGDNGNPNDQGYKVVHDKVYLPDNIQGIY